MVWLDPGSTLPAPTIHLSIGHDEGWTGSTCEFDVRNILGGRHFTTPHDVVVCSQSELR